MDQLVRLRKGSGKHKKPKKVKRKILEFHKKKATRDRVYRGLRIKKWARNHSCITDHDYDPEFCPSCGRFEEWCECVDWYWYLYDWPPTQLTFLMLNEQSDLIRLQPNLRNIFERRRFRDEQIIAALTIQTMVVLCDLNIRNLLFIPDESLPIVISRIDTSGETLQKLLYEIYEYQRMLRSVTIEHIVNLLENGLTIDFDNNKTMLELLFPNQSVHEKVMPFCLKAPTQKKMKPSN